MSAEHPTTSAAPVVARTSRYTGGIVDALRCVGMIRSSNLQTKNRLAFLTLDSTLEISMRLFLRYRKNVNLDPVKHRARYVLLAMMKKKLKQEDALWDQLAYCYDGIRCPLYHEASDMTVTNVMLDDFQETVAFLIGEMFGIDAAAAITEGVPSTLPALAQDHSVSIDLSNLKKVDAIVLALGRQPQKDTSAILAHLRSLGYTGRLEPNAISAYLSQGRYFFKDPADGFWKLTEFVGAKRYRQITEVE